MMNLPISQPACLVAIKDDRFIVADPRNAELWNAKDQARITSVSLSHDDTSYTNFTANDERTVIACLDSTGRRVRILHTSDLSLANEFFIGNFVARISIVHMASSNTMIVGYEDGRVQVMSSNSPGSWEQSCNYPGTAHAIIALTSSDRGQQISAVDRAGRTIIWRRDRSGFSSCLGVIDLHDKTWEWGFGIRASSTGAIEMTREYASKATKNWFNKNGTISIILGGTLFLVQPTTLAVSERPFVVGAGMVKGIESSGSSLLLHDAYGDNSSWDTVRGITFQFAWEWPEYFFKLWSFSWPVSLSRSGDSAFVGSLDGAVKMISLATGQTLSRSEVASRGKDGKNNGIVALTSGSNDMLYCSDEAGRLIAVDASKGDMRVITSIKLIEHDGVLRRLKSGRDSVLAIDDFNNCYVCYFSNRQIVLKIRLKKTESDPTKRYLGQSSDDQPAAAVAPSGRWFVYEGNLYQLEQIGVKKVQHLFDGATGTCEIRDDEKFCCAVGNGSLHLFEILPTIPRRGREIESWPLRGMRASGAAFLGKGALAVVMDTFQVVLFDIVSGKQLCTMSSFGSPNWAVVSPDGRFDANDLDEVRGLHWVFPDDPFHAIAPEQYLRDYYEPGLLPKLLKGEKLKEVRPLQKLNRARPEVKAVAVNRHGDLADVSVTVEGGKYKFEDGKRTDKTAVYDLRLLRDGQLVGRYPVPKDSTPDGTSDPEVCQWRKDTLVNQKTVTFRDVKLPHRPSTQPSDAVEFTAYAFNEDRVKGATSTPTTCPALAGAVQKKAYLVCVGVNDYGSPAWDLQYAAGDASCLAAELAPRLKGFTPVVMPPLLSDDVHTTATKDRIRAALERVAREATPDDLVLVFFSGHGYDAASGEFYLLPGSSRPWEEANWVNPSTATLRRCVSAEELSRWLRDVDAGETVLIIDACQSAGAVDRPGFKPGPLGNRGFGQLAYDKRMRVLAASQSDQSARELGGQIGHGVLTYALVHDGLLVDPKKSGIEISDNGSLTLKQWLTYPTKRVPKIFEEIRDKKLDDFGVKAKCPADATDAAGGTGAIRSAVNLADAGASQKDGALQVPQLFDFAKKERLEVWLAGR